MSIAFINCLKIWGGGENWHLENAFALRDEGVCVVSHPRGELARRAEGRGLRVETFRVGNWSILNPLLMLRVWLFLCREKFDVVVMNSTRDMRVFAPLAHWAGVQRIIFRRGSDIKIKDSLLNRWLFSFVTHIIANSEATARSLTTSGSFVNPSKITVLYNGIDTNQFATIARPTHQPLVVGTLGRLSYQKRHDLFIDLAHELHRRGIDCQFLIGGEGELRPSLEAKIEADRAADYVALAGNITDVPRFMSALDLFVLTSEWEGFGYVLAEAMASGLPVVAFDISSNGELVADGSNGYLVAWCDVAKMADHVEQLLADATLRERMGTTSRQLVNDRFSFSRSSQKLRALLTTNA